MRFFFLLLIILAAIQNTLANDGFALEQLSDSTKMVTPDDDIVYEVVEQMPEYPGGKAAMFSYIQKNLKFPSQAQEGQIEGTAVIEFIVEKDGTLTGFKVLKDPGRGCGDEALRVIKSMPNWKPGMQRDVAVRVRMRAPIRFKVISPEPKVNPLDSIANGMLPYIDSRYPGGLIALSGLVWKGLLLPDEIKNGTIKGVAIFSVQVDAKGNHSNYQILRDVCAGCSKAIIEKLKMMPKWSADKKQKEPMHIIFPVHYNGDVYIY